MRRLGGRGMGWGSIGEKLSIGGYKLPLAIASISSSALACRKGISLRNGYDIATAMPNHHLYFMAMWQ